MAEVVSFVDPGAAFQKFLNAVDASLSVLIPDPGDAGTIDVSNSGVLLMTTAGVETRDLPPPTFLGQKIDLILDVSAGPVTVSLTAGSFDDGTNTDLVWSSPPEACRIYAVQAGGVLAWRVLLGDAAEPTLA